MQGGNTTTLFTQIGKIESKLLDITSIVAHVSETCNNNAKFIQCLNTTILEFMQQVQMMGMVTESPKIKGQALANETNPFHMMEQKLLHFQKGKNLAQDFHVSSALGVNSRGQMSGETHIDGKNMGLGDQQPKHLGDFDSKSLTDQVSVWSM
jgi:hypothetical protein